jgi:GalNAc-alpha-(1->4)-GalNAc-alpha-(1->3)-diNAcBac-PP-undecaprenol alpha-1,4-N-acetyl-D-galactosaminyltransferase
MNKSQAWASSSPRLVLVIGSLQGGGAERQFSEMANYWAQCGVRVTLVTCSGREAEDFYPLHGAVERVRLEVRPSRSKLLTRILASPLRILRLRRLLRESRPDAVVSFIDVTNIYSILAASGLGVRVVVAERTHPAVNRGLSWPWRALRRLLYRRAAVVVAQTRDAAEWLKRHGAAHVAVIPNALRKLPQLQGERETLILAVGRLSREKGFDLLLQAFAQLRLDFPRWRLCLVGEGSERGALLQLCEALQLVDCVEFVGEVRRVEPWLARAGLLVHPSRREGFPNVVLEAMGMGVAVVCADCRAGPSELITDGSNGRLVPVDDLAALVRVMSELMADPAARARLGREACKVREPFAQEQIMQRWQACVLPAGARRAVPAESRFP